jgi:hypothetical protein
MGVSAPEMITGRCAKQEVLAMVITPTGEVFIGANYCKTPQEKCPRGTMPSGEGYEMCRDICHQVGHAEQVALHTAGPSAAGSILYVMGHTYVCAVCRTMAEAFGVREIILASEEK